ncbi:MAG: amidase family protein, partial [Actinomycetota bacterium]
FWLAREQTLAHARRIARWWADGFDLLLTPTLSDPPPPLGSFTGEPGNPLAGLARNAGYAVFTSTFNATGQPAISLPLAMSSDGLPVGVQLVAAYGREDVLIRVASQIEQAAPWRARRAPIG